MTFDGGAPVLGVHVHALHPFAQLGAYADFRTIRGTRPSSPRIASSTFARDLAPPEPRREKSVPHGTARRATVQNAAIVTLGGMTGGTPLRWPNRCQAVPPQPAIEMGNFLG
jgi:hypothetical protein